MPGPFPGEVGHQEGRDGLGGHVSLGVGVEEGDVGGPGLPRAEVHPQLHHRLQGVGHREQVHRLVHVGFDGYHHLSKRGRGINFFFLIFFFLFFFFLRDFIFKKTLFEKL